VYFSPDFIWVIKPRIMSWAGLVARMGKRRGAYKVLAGRLDGKRSLVRSRSRWGTILNRIFKKWDEGMDWINLARDRER
jgi:hypothetical protein